MAIWSSVGSVISCELPQERKKLAYRLSFVITHPSRATDTHISGHEYRQMQRHMKGVHVSASPCPFIVVYHLCQYAKASLPVWLSACLLKEVTYFLCQQLWQKMQKWRWMTTQQENRQSRNMSNSSPCVFHPSAAVRCYTAADRREKEDRVC